MRLLWTISNWKRTGPVEPSLDLALAMSRRGHDVQVLVGRVPREARARKDANTALAAAEARGLSLAPSTARLAKHGAPWRDTLDARRLRRTIQTIAPTAIVTTLDGDHRLLARAGEGRVPLARLWYVPPEAPIDGRLLRALRSTRLVVTYDDAAALRLAAAGVPAETVVRGEPALDVAALRADVGDVAAWRRTLGVPDGVALFGIVARMQRHRRFELLWQALVQLRTAGVPFRLVAIGRGTWQREVVDEPIASSGLGDLVHVAGYLRGEAYATALAALDAQIFLVPGSDPTCRALREGMALGVPSVAFRRGLLPTWVAHERTGLLVEETATALAEGLARCAADAPWRATLGATAAAEATRRFSAATVAAHFENAVLERD